MSTLTKLEFQWNVQTLCQWATYFRLFQNNTDYILYPHLALGKTQQPKSEMRRLILPLNSLSRKSNDSEDELDITESSGSGG